MKSTVTDVEDTCLLCGGLATQEHHLICGTANRKRSEELGLKIGVCAACHNFIHQYGAATRLSKILGQAIFERNYYKDLWYQMNEGENEARDKYREIFGKSYL